MDKSIMLSPLDTTELKAMIAEAVANALQTSSNQKDEEDEILNREQVCKLLNIGLVTLHNLKKDGKIPYFKAGRRILFKKKEVLKTLITQSNNNILEV